jgi:hypothetical protein
MDRLKNIIAFLHVYKTGITSIEQRYYHNKNYVYVRQKDFGVINHNSNTIPSKEIPLKDLSNDYRLFIGHGVEFDSFDSKNTIFVTCLRDPIQRMLSAYNYYILELFTLWNQKGYIDFYTWFINKDRLLPNETNYQYEHFIRSYWDLPTFVLARNHIHSGAVNGSFIMTNVRQRRVEQLKKEQFDNLYKEASLAFETLKKHCQHVLFLENNHITAFDNLIKQYDIPCYPNKDITNAHVTSTELMKNLNKKYITYDDLDSDSKELLNEYIQPDIEFYNNCKKHYGFD